MTSSSKRRLPSRFPIGTKLVLEGRRCGDGSVEVFRRYVEFPDGNRVWLPSKPAKPAPAARRRVPSPRRVPAR